LVLESKPERKEGLQWGEKGVKMAALWGEKGVKKAAQWRQKGGALGALYYKNPAR
jgi:hypothetical protein